MAIILVLIALHVFQFGSAHRDIGLCYLPSATSCFKHHWMCHLLGYLSPPTLANTQTTYLSSTADLNIDLPTICITYSSYTWLEDHPVCVCLSNCSFALARLSQGCCAGQIVAEIRNKLFKGGKAWSDALHIAAPPNIIIIIIIIIITDITCSL